MCDCSRTKNYATHCFSRVGNLPTKALDLIFDYLGGFFHLIITIIDYFVFYGAFVCCAGFIIPGTYLYLL